jgi:predicted NBD/HSP70 family sugar kinase
MRFYTKQHLYYCGVDLRARSMFICIINNKGNTIAHKNIPTDPDCFLNASAQYRQDIVVAVECIVTNLSIMAINLVPMRLDWTPVAVLK